MRLSKIAELIRVHPRTLLRALRRMDNPPYHADPDVRLADVASALGCERSVLARINVTGEAFLTQAEAAEYIGMPLRTFRHRNYAPDIHYGQKLVRYSLKRLEEIQRLEEQRSAA